MLISRSTYVWWISFSHSFNTLTAILWLWYQLTLNSLRSLTLHKLLQTDHIQVFFLSSNPSMESKDWMLTDHHSIGPLLPYSKAFNCVITDAIEGRLDSSLKQSSRRHCITRTSYSQSSSTQRNRLINRWSTSSLIEHC